MNRHRNIAGMMQPRKNISRIQFTEGSGYSLADTGDAGLEADGAIFTTGSSWTTESGKDVLNTANNSSTYPCGWHQFKSLDSYLGGPDLQFSACLHLAVTKVPQYTIGTVMSKYTLSSCGVSRLFYVAFEPDMQLRVAYFNSSTPTTQYRVIVTDDPIASVDEWIKLVVTYDGEQDGNNGLDRVKIYVNGVEESITIGYQGGAFPFDIGSTDIGYSRLSFGNALDEGTCRGYGLESKWADYIFYDCVLNDDEAALYNGAGDI